MLYLHKLLPLLLMPVMVVCALMVYALLARKRWPVAAAFVLLLVTSNQWVANHLMRSVEQHLVRLPATAASVGQADAVVVLSGMLRDVAGPNNTTASEWGDAADRFDAGLDLWRAGVAPQLIFTGGHLPWSTTTQTEGAVLRNLAVVRGIPASAILVTDNVENTAQEATAVQALLETTGASAHVVLVTSAFHMPRAKALFEQTGLRVTPYPVDFRVQVSATSPYDWLPSAQGAKDFETAWREVLGRGFYSVKRWLSHSERGVH